MKYLKHINESIADNIKQDIIEIGYDITDGDRFIMIVDQSDNSYNTNKNIYFVFIQRYINEYEISSESDEFHFNEIKDCVLRMKDYLGDRFISFEFISSHDIEWTELNDVCENTRIDKMISNICIQYEIY